jgi:hypothetical protein
VDGALSRLLGDARQPPPAGLADRVFEASRRHLPRSESELVEELVEDGVLAHIDTVGITVETTRGRDRHRLQHPQRGRWIRVALASAAMIAVAAGAILAYSRSQPEPRGDTQLVDGGGSETNPGVADGANGERAMIVNEGTNRASAAELTLVAFHNPNASRMWLSEESLGGSDAAALAAPVLRTHGAELDDIEGELGEILGLSFASGPGGSSRLTPEAGSF